MPSFQPAYIEAFKSGLILDRINNANSQLENCSMCPRKCEVNRAHNELGICKTGMRAAVASYSPHFGEEAPLVGEYGSGTIFFTHCNLGCNFCQNADISRDGYGIEVTSSHLARIMINLQHLGCHNINLVTPSHVVPQILAALNIAIKNGLNIPLVYNTSGYDLPETLELLDGIVDIYMPDFKFWDRVIAVQTCNASDYPEVARIAIKEMYRQVGDLQIINGKALRGLLIRHLVLPYDLAGTEKIVRYISNEISKSSYVNIMAQFRPNTKINHGNHLDRTITEKEYTTALELARNVGLFRLN